MIELIGINSRGKDPWGPQRKFNHVREYHPWPAFIGYDDNRTANARTNLVKLDPAYDPFTVRFDDNYSFLPNQAMPVLQSNAPEHRGINSYPSSFPEATNMKPFFHPSYASTTPLRDSFFVESGGDWQWVTNYPIAWKDPGAGEGLFGAEVPQALVTRASLSTSDFWRRVSDRAFSISDDAWQQNPFNYIPHAEDLTLHALRYGSNSNPSQAYTNFFADRSNESALFGQGTVSWVENQNEPDRWWNDTKNLLETPSAVWQLLPEYVAAMTSADYDGHGGALVHQPSGATLGVKSVDPSIQLSLPGLSNFRTEYVGDLMDWCVSNRIPGVGGFISGPQLPFDAINFHHYANFDNPTEFGQWVDEVAENITTGTDENTTNPDGRSPEREKLKEQLEWSMQETTHWAAVAGVDPSEYATKQFFLSEFGYDSEDDGAGAGSSPYDVPGDNARERWLYHAQWYVRSFLEISAAHYLPADDDWYVDPDIGRDYSVFKSSFMDQEFSFSQAHAYELKDDPGRGSGTGQFQTCGLYYQTPDQQYTPKTAWYFVQGLRNALGQYRFVGEMEVSYTPTATTPSGLDLRAYLYEHKDGTDRLDRYQIAWWLAGEALEAFEIQDLVLTYPDDPSIFSLLSAIDELPAAAYELSTRSTIPQHRSYDPTTLDISNTTWSYFGGTVPVSETPRFLTVDLPEQLDFPSVSDITVSASCCRGVEVRWRGENPGGNYTFDVWVVAADDLNGDFRNLDLVDPSSAHVVTNVTTRRAFVQGLTPGRDYVAYIIPVQNSGQSPNWGVGPTQLNPADYAYGVFSVGGCTASCFLPVTPGMITASDATSLTQGQQILVTGNSPVSCDDLAGNDFTTTGWDAFAPAWIVVDFGAPHRIDAMYLLDFTSTGILEIEGQYCDCSTDWTPITSYRTAYFGQYVEIQGIGEWSKIRLRKRDGGNIGTTRFCGELGVLDCEGGVTGVLQPNEAFPDFPRPFAPRVTAPTRTATTAHIEWNFPAVDSIYAELGVTKRFRVSVSKKESGEWSMIDQNVEVNFLDGSVHGFYALEGLDPTGTYKVEVEPVAARPGADCSYAGSGVGGTVIVSPYTSAPGGTDLRGPGAGVPVPVELHFEDWKIAPNPTVDRVDISHPEQCSRIFVVDLQGRVVLEKEVTPTATRTSLQLAELPVGMFAIVLQHKGAVLKKWLSVTR